MEVQLDDLDLMEVQLDDLDLMEVHLDDLDLMEVQLDGLVVTNWWSSAYPWVGASECWYVIQGAQKNKVKYRAQKVLAPNSFAVVHHSPNWSHLTITIAKVRPVPWEDCSANTELCLKIVCNENHFCGNCLAVWALHLGSGLTCFITVCFTAWYAALAALVQKDRNDDIL